MKPQSLQPSNFKDNLDLTSLPEARRICFADAGLPCLPGAYYISEKFLDQKFQQELFDECVSLRGSSKHGITRKYGPRLRAYRDRAPEQYPPVLSSLVTQLLSRGILLDNPFQVSVNYYDSSNYQMMPHKDGSGTQGVIVSLGSHTVLEFYHKKEVHRSGYTEVFEAAELRDPIRVLLEPGSVLVLTQESFIDYVHGITLLDADKINDSIANLKLCNSSVSLKSSIPRAPRVSIVLWNDDD